MIEIMDFKTCELTVFITILISTAISLLIGGKHLLKVIKGIKNGVFVKWDIHHSNQHLAIYWTTMLISAFMFFNTSFNAEHLTETFVEHLFYNLMCIFIIYPHLNTEE